MKPSIPPALVLLTVTTGMVDAVSFLKLGHVFVANMTGNVAFLGFAAAGYRGISASGSVLAVLAFLAGAFAGGRLAARSASPARLLVNATIVKVVLALAGIVIVATTVIVENTPAAYALIVVLALALGVQNAAARKIAVPDFTTTVLTLTMTGIAADFGSGESPKLARRFVSIASMFLGALAGAVLVLHASLLYAVVVIACLFGVTAILALHALRDE
ncbi:MAG TPA: YoaK family protein [Candidatus Elarobacter sp.]|jgi:uncharacterized membrane protein YoaK (UPF0700 family)|nr:YoaK family protein [Candidatus Elarobacter sp.]